MLYIGRMLRQIFANRDPGTLYIYIGAIARSTHTPDSVFFADCGGAGEERLPVNHGNAKIMFFALSASRFARTFEPQNVPLGVHNFPLKYLPVLNPRKLADGPHSFPALVSSVRCTWSLVGASPEARPLPPQTHALTAHTSNQQTLLPEHHTSNTTAV